MRLTSLQAILNHELAIYDELPYHEPMRIINLNPDTAIGASAWFLELDGHRLLMDAGTHPKLEGYASLPLYKLIANEPVDAVAISHCHHDHVGSLPVAMRYFPEANVLLTELSYFLVERVLHNSVNVMTRQRDEMGIREYPLTRTMKWMTSPRCSRAFGTIAKLNGAPLTKNAPASIRRRWNSTMPDTPWDLRASWCGGSARLFSTPAMFAFTIKPSCAPPVLKM